MFDTVRRRSTFRHHRRPPDAAAFRRGTPPAQTPAWTPPSRCAWAHTHTQSMDHQKLANHQWRDREREIWREIACNNVASYLYSSLCARGEPWRRRGRRTGRLWRRRGGGAWLLRRRRCRRRCTPRRCHRARAPLRRAAEGPGLLRRLLAAAPRRRRSPPAARRAARRRLVQHGSRRARTTGASSASCAPSPLSCPPSHSL